MTKTNKRTNNADHMSRGAKIAVFAASLLGAFLVWIYAFGYDTTPDERQFSGIQVIIEGQDALLESKGYTLAENQSFSSINITAKGTRAQLGELTSADFRAVVDVSQATGAGYQTLNVVVYSPFGIEIVEQSVSTARVFVDEFTQRNELLSVSVDTGDSYVMSEGVTFVSAVANPLSVTVSGPKSVLDEIAGAYVNFNLNGKEISENISAYGDIQLRDKKGNTIESPYLVISDTTAYVTINVTKQKTVPVRVSFVGGIYSTSDAAIDVSAKTVTVSGNTDALNAIDELVLTIDERSVDGTMQFDFSIGALLPSGVTNESGVSTVTVTVTLPEQTVRTYTVGAERITVLNLPEGYTYEVLDDISVTLIGAREAFAQFDSELMIASVNFDRVTVEPDGSGYTATVNFDLGGQKGIYVQSKDYSVKFTVTAPVVLPDGSETSDPQT